jgi:hypothetical protein
MIVSKIFFLVLSAASRMFLESRAFGVHSNIGMTVTGWPGDSCTIAVGTSVSRRPPPRSVREELLHTAPTLGD